MNLYRVISSGGGCWPTERQHLLIGAATGRLDADHAWLDYLDRIRDGKVNEGEVRLFPLLDEKLSPQARDDPRFAPIRREKFRTIARGARLLRAAITVRDALAAVGVECVMIKGFALSATVYRAYWQRPFSDIDVMVRPECIEKVMGLARDSGWRSSREYPSSFTASERYRHAYAYILQDNTEIDIHWSLRGAFLWDDRSLARFWGDVAATNWDGSTWLVPSATWILIDTIEHGLRWNEVHSVRWVVDGVRVSLSGGINWDQLVECATAARRTLAFHKALCLIRDCGGRVPAGTLDRLLAIRSSLAERAECRAREAKTGFFGDYLTAAPLNYFLRAPGRRPAKTILFPRYYLRVILGCDDLASLPARMVRKFGRRRRELSSAVLIDATNRSRPI